MLFVKDERVAIPLHYKEIRGHSQVTEIYLQADTGAYLFTGEVE